MNPHRDRVGGRTPPEDPTNYASCDAVLATQRHSGTHSCLGILLEHFARHSLTENKRTDTDAKGAPALWFSHSEPEKIALLRQRCRESEVVICAMRDPMDVYYSWLRRGKTVGKWFCQLWENLFAIHDENESYWMPVDTPDRDEYLARISERIGVNIETDWKRRGAFKSPAVARVGQNMTETQVRAFYRSLPFEQFGYGD